MLLRGFVSDIIFINVIIYDQLLLRHFLLKITIQGKLEGREENWLTHDCACLRLENFLLVFNG